MTLDVRAEAWVRLALVPIPEIALAALLRAFGSPERILAASRGEIAAMASMAVAARIQAPVENALLEAARRWLAEPGHELVAWDDPDYPKSLLDVGAGPPLLFYVGKRALLNRPSLAIVGSRHATPQGLDNARAFASALSRGGLTIVSGLALGIDGAAHHGALQGRGSTIACVGTGLDRVYPAAHRDLAHAIAADGGLVSEFFPGTPPLKANFPRRNRLISGLARGVLVVEASLASGSLITARLAGEQGREVFAIPGSIHSPLSKGCHKLIRDGAKLVETAQDVLDELGLASSTDPPRPDPQHEPGHARSSSHAHVIAALGADPCDLDTLVARTHLDADALVAALVELELDGYVAALPGGRWQRLG